jgi:hypothetical protein
MHSWAFAPVSGSILKAELQQRGGEGRGGKKGKREEGGKPSRAVAAVSPHPAHCMTSYCHACPHVSPTLTR